MSTSLEKNYKSMATLLHFNAGTYGELKLCDLSTTLTLPEGTFLADPRIEVTNFPERSGGFEEKDLVVRMRNRDSFIQRMTNGFPFAPVQLTVYEYFFDEIGSSTAVTLKTFTGKVSEVIKNKGGKEDIVQIKAMSTKSRLNFPLGITCNIQCSWTFGDNNCQKTITSMANTVDSIDGTLITVGTTPDPGTYPSGLFRKGYISRQGINILIRNWVSGDTFQLAKFCPPDWLGQAVTIYAGCDRNLETCEGIHNNRARFGGLGKLMTAYNPVAEEP